MNYSDVTRGGTDGVGAALGAQNAANSLGLASGPLLGGALFVWQVNAPYLPTGALLVAVALAIGWKAWIGSIRPDVVEADTDETGNPLELQASHAANARLCG